MPDLDLQAQSQGLPSHVAQAFMAHAMAGAAAGMAETAVMYPVDTIKTRLQVISDALLDTIPCVF